MIRKIIGKTWNGIKKLGSVTKLALFGWALAKCAKKGAKVAAKTVQKSKKEAK